MVRKFALQTGNGDISIKILEWEEKPKTNNYLINQNLFYSETA